MKTTIYKGMLFAWALLFLFGATKLGATSMPDTYLDYDGGIAPHITGEPDSYTDYNGWLPVSGAITFATGEMPDTYTDYDGGLPVSGYLQVTQTELQEVIVDIALAAGVTQEEMLKAQPYVADYCACSVERGVLKTTLANAAEMGCRGNCFTEAAKCMRDGVESGLSAEKTADVLVVSLEAVRIECEDKGLDLREDTVAEMLHREFEHQLAVAKLPH